jgi:pantoate kinase
MNKKYLLIASLIGLVVSLSAAPFGQGLLDSAGTAKEKATAKAEEAQAKAEEAQADAESKIEVEETEETE